MAEKKITPTNPETAHAAQDEATGTGSGAPVDRKTASASGRFRKTASFKFGRKTNSFKI